MTDKAIPSLLATLFERLSGQEDLELEVKRGRGGLPRDLWETVSAFANTSGGWIVLGIDQQGDTLTVEGTPNPSALLSDFHNTLRNRNKVSYPVCGAADSAIETIEGRQLLILRVRAVSRKERPVYINGNPYTGTYVRRHSGDYLCTKPEVDRMMREASDIAADSTILKHFGWDDLDVETLARYRRRFQTMSPASPWNGYDDLRFLQALGGYRRDREAGQEGITVAGLLLAGRSEALRDWRDRYLIDYRLVSGDADADTRWHDRLVCEDNLLTAFERIYPRLVADRPVPFRLVGETRIDETPSHVALREARVNFLVHADYAETQASLILQSPEGSRFRNPGSSRIPELDLMTGDRSDPRNPHLVRMFRLIGLADEAGTGIPKILRSWRELGFHMPAIDGGTERYEFTLELRQAHLLSDEDRHWLRALGESWTEPEQLALVMARHDGDVENLKLRRVTGQHPADVTKVLGGLRNRGLLQMIGGGRGARYQLGPAAAGDQASRIPSPFDAEKDAVGASSTGNRASSEGSSSPP